MRPPRFQDLNSRWGFLFALLMLPVIFGMARLLAQQGEGSQTAAAIASLSVSAAWLAGWKSRSMAFVAGEHGGLLRWFKSLARRWLVASGVLFALFMLTAGAWQAYLLVYEGETFTHLVATTVAGLYLAGGCGTLLTGTRIAGSHHLQTLAASRKVAVAAMPWPGKLLAPLFSVSAGMLDWYLWHVDMAKPFLGRRWAHAGATITFVVLLGAPAVILIPSLVAAIASRS